MCVPPHSDALLLVLQGKPSSDWINMCTCSRVMQRQFFFVRPIRIYDTWLHAVPNISTRSLSLTLTLNNNHLCKFDTLLKLSRMIYPLGKMDVRVALYVPCTVCCCMDVFWRKTLRLYAHNAATTKIYVSTTLTHV